MPTFPKVQLSRLRDIGFGAWDPIGILKPGEPWKDHAAAAEYDSYLLQVVTRLRAGASEADAVDYLVRAESEHMGLGMRAAMRDRAMATVRGVRAYLDELSARENGGTMT